MPQAVASAARKRQRTALVTYDTHPDRYAHWRLVVRRPVATLAMNVNEDRGIGPGYKLKLNSYDLGVDIELPTRCSASASSIPRCAASSSPAAGERMFCSGANIFMLGLSTHALEGELLQVHQRDAQRHRGREPRTPGSSSSPPATARPPAAATSWRSPATRSS